MAVYRTTVRLGFPVGSGGGTNTWHVRTTGDGVDGTDLRTAMGWVSSFYTACSALFCQGYTATWDGSGFPVDGGEPQLIEGQTGWNLTLGGTNIGAAAAPATICVTWRSLVRTRSGRGRTFLGPLAPNVMQNDGTLATASLATVRDAAAALVASSSGGDASGAVAVWSESESIARDVVAATVTDQVAVLRSRRR